MRSLLALAFLAFSASAAAERFDDFWPLAEGGRPKSEMQADSRFVDSMVSLAGSAQAATRQLMDKGWEYVRKRDTERAMRRFNQAYLLDPMSAEAYWGLGTVASQLGRPEAALRLLEHAHALKKKNEAALLTDIGFAYIQLALGRDENKVEKTRALKKALEWLDRAELANPEFPLVWANRAIIHYYQGEYLAAWKDIERAEALDDGYVDPRIAQELSAKMPRPGASERLAAAGARLGTGRAAGRSPIPASP